MRVTEILVHVELIRFPLIVFALVHNGIGGEYRRTVVEIDRDVAFQTDGKTKISACGKINGTSTLRRRGLDRFVDGIGVERFAVADRSRVSYVKKRDVGLDGVRVTNSLRRQRSVANGEDDRRNSSDLGEIFHEAIWFASVLRSHISGFGQLRSAGNSLFQFKSLCQRYKTWLRSQAVKLWLDL